MLQSFCFIDIGKNEKLLSTGPKVNHSSVFFCPLQFHQTIKTYLNHRIWQFYFYVSKNWPDEEVCLHFPGCTLTPNHNIYESFGVFCSLDTSHDAIELIKAEDVLFDWSMPLYLNYTHVNIMDRVEEFLATIGNVERIEGEVFVCKNSPDCLDLGELPSNEVVRIANRLDHQKLTFALNRRCAR